jgi:hypothetical protein
MQLEMTALGWDVDESTQQQQQQHVLGVKELQVNNSASARQIQQQHPPTDDECGSTSFSFSWPMPSMYTLRPQTNRHKCCVFIIFSWPAGWCKARVRH